MTGTFFPALTDLAKLLDDVDKSSAWRRDNFLRPSILGHKPCLRT